jgi:hypothetical protein
MYTVYWNYTLEEEFFNGVYQGKEVKLHFFPTFQEGLGEFQITAEQMGYFDGDYLADYQARGYTIEGAICEMLNGDTFDFSQLCATLYERAGDVEDAR